MGELHSIGQEVVQDLQQAHRVAAPDAQGRGRDIDAEVQMLGERGRLVRGLDLGGHVLGVELDVLELHAPGLDLRQVEDVVEHGQERLARLADDPQPFTLLGRHLAHGHDLGHGQDSVQRGADLVAHIGQEVRLQHIGRLGRVARLHQLVHGLVQGPVVALQLGQQGVEAFGQAAELVVLAMDHPSREVAGAGHLLHGVRQPVDRTGEPGGQPAAHEQGQARGDEEQGAAHGEEAGQKGAGALRLDRQHQGAGAAVSEVDRSADVDDARAFQRQRAADRAETRDRLAVGADQLGAEQAGVGLQGPQRRQRVGAIAPVELLGDVGGADARERLLSLDEVSPLGAPLLQHEQQAGAHQHHHGGDQGHHRDPALERQAADRESQLHAVAGGRLGRVRAGGVVLDLGSDVGAHRSPWVGF